MTEKKTVPTLFSPDLADTIRALRVDPQSGQFEDDSPDPRTERQSLRKHVEREALRKRYTRFLERRLGGSTVKTGPEGSVGEELAEELQALIDPVRDAVTHQRLTALQASRELLRLKDHTVTPQEKMQLIEARQRFSKSPEEKGEATSQGGQGEKKGEKKEQEAAPVEQTEQTEQTAEGPDALIDLVDQIQQKRQRRLGIIREFNLLNIPLIRSRTLSDQGRDLLEAGDFTRLAEIVEANKGLVLDSVQVFATIGLMDQMDQAEVFSRTVIDQVLQAKDTFFRTAGSWQVQTDRLQQALSTGSTEQEAATQRVIDLITPHAVGEDWERLYKSCYFAPIGQRTDKAQAVLLELQRLRVGVTTRIEYLITQKRVDSRRRGAVNVASLREWAALDDDWQGKFEITQPVVDTLVRAETLPEVEDTPQEAVAKQVVAEFTQSEETHTSGTQIITLHQPEEDGQQPIIQIQLPHQREVFSHTGSENLVFGEGSPLYEFASGIIGEQEPLVKLFQAIGPVLFEESVRFLENDQDARQYFGGQTADIDQAHNLPQKTRQELHRRLAIRVIAFCSTYHQLSEQDPPSIVADVPQQFFYNSEYLDPVAQALVVLQRRRLGHQLTGLHRMLGLEEAAYLPQGMAFPTDKNNPLSDAQLRQVLIIANQVGNLNIPQLRLPTTESLVTPLPVGFYQAMERVFDGEGQYQGIFSVDEVVDHIQSLSQYQDWEATTQFRLALTPVYQAEQAWREIKQFVKLRIERDAILQEAQSQFDLKRPTNFDQDVTIDSLADVSPEKGWQYGGRFLGRGGERYSPFSARDYLINRVTEWRQAAQRLNLTGSIDRQEKRLVGQLREEAIITQQVLTARRAFVEWYREQDNAFITRAVSGVNLGPSRSIIGSEEYQSEQSLQQDHNLLQDEVLSQFEQKEAAKLAGLRDATRKISKHSDRRFAVADFLPPEVRSATELSPGETVTTAFETDMRQRCRQQIEVLNGSTEPFVRIIIDNTEQIYSVLRGNRQGLNFGEGMVSLLDWMQFIDRLQQGASSGLGDIGSLVNNDRNKPYLVVAIICGWRSKNKDSQNDLQWRLSDSREAYMAVSNQLATIFDFQT